MERWKKEWIKGVAGKKERLMNRLIKSGESVLER